MFTYFSKVKSLLRADHSLRFPLVLSKNTLSLSSSRKFSIKVNFEDTSVWAKMSEEERMGCAMTDSEPKTAKMAYYQGMALKKFGHGYYNDAISAFEKAAELDKIYKSPSEKQIADVYESLGKTDETIQFLKRAYNDLLDVKADAKKVEVLRRELNLNIVAFQP